tara:strand:+ start:965 stop:1189 length:225 start_codon:yes stop_codon:yes gene_type:complete
MFNKITFTLFTIISLIYQTSNAAPQTNGTSTNWMAPGAWTPSGAPVLTYWGGGVDAIVSHDMISLGLTINSDNS